MIEYVFSNELELRYENVGGEYRNEEVWTYITDRFLNDRFILIARQSPLIFGKCHEVNHILFT